LDRQVGLEWFNLDVQQYSFYQFFFFKHFSNNVMHKSIDLRKYFNPMQPTIKETNDNITYIEYLPDVNLQTYIYCYWELKTNQVLANEFYYRVVADGCIDIFFELDKPSENYVMGFCNKYVEFTLGKSFHYIGIRFLPTMFSQIFKINASELSNQVELLEVVAPQTSTFIANFISTKETFKQVKNVFDQYFLNMLSNVKWDEDVRLYNAINIILKKAGVIHVGKDLDTGVSPRQLRRLFEFYIGDTAKTFSKVVRFQNILRAKSLKQSLRENKLFFDMGYYDQAHFIKEFKHFYGDTPCQTFGVSKTRVDLNARV
jgi:YesN/AraC family two-component response regulator